MLDLMYTVPSQNSISECVITKKVVLNRDEPVMLFRKAG
jgi:ATP-dependent protease Clp ATPase subunit